MGLVSHAGASGAKAQGEIRAKEILIAVGYLCWSTPVETQFPLAVTAVPTCI